MSRANSEGPGRQRFAFVTIGPFSGINARILPLLEASFAAESDAIDVSVWARANRRLLAVNLAFVLREYGPTPLLDRRHLWGTFFRTSYIFRRIKAMMERRLTSRNYIFSFQTQSMFDASARGIPHFVYTDHTALANTYYPGFDRSRLPSSHWLAREKEIYQQATLNFTMSTHVSQSLVELYGIEPERVACVYAGSNAEPPDEASLKNEYASKRILFVGRDWHRKGGATLLAAFRRVCETHPDARLVIAGCTPEIDSPNVTVLGEIRAEDVSEWYQRSAIFCMPTLVEPFGVAFVEALAHRVPVVATRIGALPDIVQEGESGELVDTGDVERLAESLTRLLGDPERCRQLGQTGRERMLERYTWPRVVDAMSDHIRHHLASIKARNA